MSQHILKDRPWWKMATLQPGLWLWWMTSAHKHQDHESCRNSEYPVTYHRPAENANMSRAWMLTEYVVTYWALTSNLSTLCLRTEVAAADMTERLQDSERTYSTPTRPKTNTTVGSPRTNQHTAADKTVNWHAHRLTWQPTEMPANWQNNQTSMTVNRHNSKPTQQQLTSGDPNWWQSNTRWMVAKRTDITANTSGCWWGFDPAWLCDPDNIMVIYSSSIACIRLYRRWSCIVQHILSGNFTLHVRGTRWHIIHTVSLHILQPSKKIKWNPANHSWLHVTNGTDRQPVNRINYQAAWVGLQTQVTDTQQVSILHYSFTQI